MAYTIIVRCLIIYLLVLFLLRFMGKKQIGQMQPYELVITLVIADLACIPMADSALPILHGIIPLLTIVLIHSLFAYLDRKSLWFRKFLNGKPVILISPKGIEYENLKMCNMNFNDLQEGLRTCGYFKLDEILYAIIQTNGTICVLPKAMNTPATPKDMKLEVEEASLPMIIVAEGKVVKENLCVAKIEQETLENELKQAGFDNIKDIMIATLSTNGNMYIQGNLGPYSTYESSLKGSW